MNTMYAAVAYRTKEIGTLRALPVDGCPPFAPPAFLRLALFGRSEL